MESERIEAEAKPVEPERESDGLETGWSVRAYLRTSPPSAAARRQGMVVETLRTLASEGTIPDLSIERWSRQVALPVPEAESRDATMVGLYEEFRRVADRAGIRLRPFFQERQAAGGLLPTDRSADRIVVFPVVCVTIRRDDDLVGFYPCWRDGTHHGVEDCLTAFAEGGEVENL